jgi:hypothetical protein
LHEVLFCVAILVNNFHLFYDCRFA